MSLNLPLNEYVDDRTFYFRRNIQLMQVNIYLSENVIVFNEAINFCDISMPSFLFNGLNIKTTLKEKFCSVIRYIRNKYKNTNGVLRMCFLKSFRVN